ncbi:MAG: hypothetical protein ACYS17_12960, partial [Planctomycetota bacterium]
MSIRRFCQFNFHYRKTEQKGQKKNFERPTSNVEPLHIRRSWLVTRGSSLGAARNDRAGGRDCRVASLLAMTGITETGAIN